MFDATTIEKIKDQILSANETLAVAESVTSGFLQAAFSTAKDASMFFQGGVTTYNLLQKYQHLKIDPVHAQACNCVSQKVAIEMAKGVGELFNSTWGIGITGYATPVPESGNELYAHYAISYKSQLMIVDTISADNPEGTDVQLSYVQQVLKGFESLIVKHKK